MQELQDLGTDQPAQVSPRSATASSSWCGLGVSAWTGKGEQGEVLTPRPPQTNSSLPPTGLPEAIASPCPLTLQRKLMLKPKAPAFLEPAFTIVSVQAGYLQGEVRSSITAYLSMLAVTETIRAWCSPAPRSTAEDGIEKRRPQAGTAPCWGRDKESTQQREKGRVWYRPLRVYSRIWVTE